MKSATVHRRQYLPDPAERPASDVVVFDGFCRFCNSQMRLLHRLDLTGALTFLSLHEARSEALLPGMSFEEKMSAMVVVDSQGRKHAGARAVRYLSRRMPLLWWMAPLLHIPGSLGFWQRIYNMVARSRYRFGRMECDGGTCDLHGY